MNTPKIPTWVGLALALGAPLLSACPKKNPSVPASVPVVSPVTPPPTVKPGPPEIEGTITETEWSSWLASSPTPTAPDSGGPQYDPGSIGLTDTDPAPDVLTGYVYVWGSVNITEGFEINDLGRFHSSGNTAVDEVEQTAMRGGNNLTISDFDALKKSNPATVCTANDTNCWAKHIYAWQDFPSTAPTAPSGAKSLVTVQSQFDTVCASGFDESGVSAIVHRTRVVLSGTDQAKWVEHWYARKSTSDSNVQYRAPDECESISDTHTRLDLQPASTTLAVGAVHDKLKNINCNGESWCNFCGTNGVDCRHTQIVLEWWKLK